ncbi:hypothetical protein ACHAW5_000626 [Stephanodiscus triporus]|uniref:Response regulatory domain-containing protein n=1 Tax=Stephanodiscus triporus TaxID=2934178 RepID=A0ABD3PU99_9STRA
MTTPALVAAASEFELEEALFATAPVGVHCVDVDGVVLWANRTELNFLGFADYDGSEYVGRCVSSFVYSDAAGGGGRPSLSQHQHVNVNDVGAASAAAAANLVADDRTLYSEVLRRVTMGNPVCEIPIRFVTRSGAIVHLLLDCDGTAILRRGHGAGGSSHYFRFFTRDDTARRIQEMRSNVLFQETNRSLQLLDDFMNRSMQQMRAPLTLMERACNLVAEYIEDIDEVVRRNTSAAYSAMIESNNNHHHRHASNGNENGGGGIAVGNANMIDDGKSGGGKEDNDNNGEQNPARTNGVLLDNAVANLLNFTAPLTLALSATSEARSVVGLAATLTKDALALVDDITDLCRFDQGRALLVEKEAVKIREICLEALEKVSSSSGGSSMGGSTMVDVVFDVQEGSPGRVVTDRCVLQRSLTLLLNFAVDAAANAASTTAVGGGATLTTATSRGRVILSIQELRGGGETTGACRVSVFYTNPPEAAHGGMNIMGSAAVATGGGGGSAPVEHSATAFASAYTSSSSVTSNEQQHYNQPPNIVCNNDVVNFSHHSGMGVPSSPGGGSGGVGITPTNEDVVELLQNYHTSAQGGTSMMRRIRLRENIQSGMTSCRRDKLGLGLSLLYHLVGAQGSDLRYEIVSEQRNQGGGMVLPTMTKFWFLLPMSLDFPDRLPAEQIVVKDGSHGINSQGGQLLSIPLSVRSPLLSAPLMVPDDGMGIQQQRQKKAKLSHQPVPLVPLNSILGTMTAAPAPAESSSFASAFTPVFVAYESAPLKSDNELDDVAIAVATSPSKQYPGVAPGARPLVLVVEDTDVSASLLCMHLRKLNCTSHRAENGEVAIEMLRSAPAPNMYSLILMDLRMPVMDGFEATTIIKGSNACNIPVVALTGETSEENRRRCDEIGFDDYKTKPLKRPQLEELLHKFVPGYTH